MLKPRKDCGVPAEQLSELARALLGEHHIPTPSGRMVKGYAMSGSGNRDPEIAPVRTTAPVRKEDPEKTAKKKRLANFRLECVKHGLAMDVASIQHVTEAGLLAMLEEHHARRARMNRLKDRCVRRGIASNWMQLAGAGEDALLRMLEEDTARKAEAKSVTAFAARRMAKASAFEAAADLAKGE